MQLSQLVALGILPLIIGGLAFTFVRSGAEVKPHNNPDNWQSYTGGGSGQSGADSGAGPSS